MYLKAITLRFPSMSSILHKPSACFNRNPVPINICYINTILPCLCYRLLLHEILLLVNVYTEILTMLIMLKFSIGFHIFMELITKIKEVILILVKMWKSFVVSSWKFTVFQKIFSCFLNEVERYLLFWYDHNCASFMFWVCCWCWYWCVWLSCGFFL